MIDFENLPRWMYASCSKWVVGRSNSAITFLEGLDKPDQDPKEGAEFRMDGPRITELSKGYYEVWVAINVLVQTALSDDDFHARHRVVGKIVKALNSPIPIYKYGDGPDDDGTVKIGCLTLIHDKFNRIQVNYFGQVGQAVRLEQGTIEAHYHMYLTEES